MKENRFNLPNPWVQADFASEVADGKIVDSRLLAKRREENRDRIERERNVGRKGSAYDPLKVSMTRQEVRRIK